MINLAKAKTCFLCNNCGYESIRWLGKCPSCQQWNTLQEFKVPGKASHPSVPGALGSQPQAITMVEPGDEDRLPVNIGDLDLVLGGGLVPGSLVLIGGEPGIGKSTLLLQVAYALASQGSKVLYVTGEESARQVSLRANRLGALHSGVMLLAEHDLESIETHANTLAPDMVVIDSVQTLMSEQLSAAPGTVSQVRECTARLMRLARKTGAAMLLIGHVTKDGSLAGPKALEHMVDTVLYFEGDRHHAFRLLRSVKNRYGSTNEIGVFLMASSGLEPVLNPSELFLSQRGHSLPGSVVAATMEGSRPLLVEIQALVAPSGWNNPRRMADGIDYNRSALLLAVLEKRAGLHLYNHDVYINVVGGAKIAEPAVDLAVILAAASAFRDKPVSRTLLAFGEVGLTGEVRPVPRLEQRLREGVRLGFSQAVVPAPADLKIPGLTLNPVENVNQAIAVALGGDV